MKIRIQFKAGNEVFWGSRIDGDIDALVNGAKKQFPNVLVLRIERTNGNATPWIWEPRIWGAE